MKMNYLFVLAALLISGCHTTVDPAPQPEPTPTITASPTPEPTPSPTITPSPSPSPSPTPSPSPSPSPSPTDAPYIGDSSFQPYVNKFVNYAVQEARPVDTSHVHIQLGDLSSYGQYVIGLCESGYNVDPVVTFSTNFWNSTNDTQRELLSLHELGHCVLNRAHRNDVDANGNPVSIMYPVIISNTLYNSAKASYLDELYHYGWSALMLEEDTADHTWVCGPGEL